MITMIYTHGGVLVWPLLVTLLLVLTIAVERCIFFYRTSIDPHSLESYIVSTRFEEKKHAINSLYRKDNQYYEGWLYLLCSFAVLFVSFFLLCRYWNCHFVTAIHEGIIPENSMQLKDGRLLLMSCFISLVVMWMIVMKGARALCFRTYLIIILIQLSLQVLTGAYLYYYRGIGIHTALAVMYGFMSAANFILLLIALNKKWGIKVKSYLESVQLERLNSSAPWILYKKYLETRYLSFEGQRCVLRQCGTREVDRMMRYLNVLSTITSIAPLMGLLGTVIGIIKVFMNVSNLSGGMNMQLISNGLWEALLTTAVGLTVGILAYLTFNICNSIAEKRESFLRVIVDILDQKYYEQEREKA